MKQCLEVQQRVLEEGHIDFVDSIKYIGIILDKQKKHSEAIKYLEQALLIREKHYGFDTI